MAKNPSHYLKPTNKLQYTSNRDRSNSILSNASKMQKEKADNPYSNLIKEAKEVHFKIPVKDYSSSTRKRDPTESELDDFLEVSFLQF